MPDHDFASAWQHASGVDGWLTEEQASMLHAQACAVAPATVVEIGSHLGRSTIVLASSGACVVAIDPFGADWKYGTADTRTRFEANLAAAGVREAVRVLPTTSHEARRTWNDPVALLYVDGKHDLWSCRDDLRWSRFMSEGSTVLVHDGFSSLGVTAALLVELVLRPRFVLVDRAGSMVRLRVGRPRGVERWRSVRHLPWFARNLLVKILLRLRLRPVAALLGHRDTADPY
jgi:hypothetical protein